MRSDLEVDWLIYEENMRQFEKENSRAKHRFRKRTEEILKKAPGNRMGDAVRRDRRRREERQRERATNSKELDPADFNKFMRTHHNQAQLVLAMEEFTVVDECYLT